MDLPLVTIGLPVYNGERTVTDAVRSVLAQTYQNWELIIVDDGSTDNTREIVERLSDSRIRIDVEDNNHGLSSCLNKIARLSRGDFIARLDADDLLHPERIERQVEYMLANQKVDALGCSMYLMDNSNRVYGVRKSIPVVHTVKSALRRSPLMHATVMTRREWSMRHPYDESFRRAQDRELWCRTIVTSNFTNLPASLYFCREAGMMSPREYLKKYLVNQDTRMSLLKLYGRDHLSLVERMASRIEALLKVEVYRLYSWFGVHASSVLRKSHKLEESERETAQSTVEDILSEDTIRTIRS